MQTDIFYGWCAGIIDGEGHVSLDKCRKQRRPIVTVGNTDYKIIDKLYKNFGGYVLLQQKKGNRLPCWIWSLRGKKVIFFLEKVGAYLISKKNKAKIVLEYAYTIGNKPIDESGRNNLVKKLDLIK